MRVVRSGPVRSVLVLVLSVSEMAMQTLTTLCNIIYANTIARSICYPMEIAADDADNVDVVGASRLRSGVPKLITHWLKSEWQVSVQLPRQQTHSRAEYTQHAHTLAADSVSASFHHPVFPTSSSRRRNRSRMLCALFTTVGRQQS